MITLGLLGDLALIPNILTGNGELAGAGEQVLGGRLSIFLLASLWTYWRV